ncbi:MAG: pyrroline-5-carboxylate reductase [Selenomonadaceae bacterium]|nr:pyrroline-5-carboxylate reductase [Selenomonadaceae bacterium]
METETFDLDESELYIGFVGGGALTESIINAIRGTLLPSGNIFVSDHKRKRCTELTSRYRVNASVGVDPFIDKVKLLVVAVKPKDAPSAFAEIRNKITLNTVIISVIAGLKIELLEKFFPHSTIVRAMPNVPILVGEGMTAYTINRQAVPSDRKLVEQFWASIGRAIELEEKFMDAVTGLSGSGPAYAFLMIDALSDGGVAAGLSRAAAIELAAQTLLGAAKMVLETGEHPAALRDKVTSPAGTTIEGIRVLEKNGVRSALIEAVLAATEKSRLLGGG